jgi:hypothetical protein
MRLIKQHTRVHTLGVALSMASVPVVFARQPVRAAKVHPRPDPSMVSPIAKAPAGEPRLVWAARPRRRPLPRADR